MFLKKIKKKHLNITTSNLKAQIRNKKKIKINKKSKDNLKKSMDKKNIQENK